MKGSFQHNTNNTRSIELDDNTVVDDFDIINFEGDVTVTNDGDQKGTVVIGETGQYTGKLLDLVYSNTGNAADKWMNLGNGTLGSNVLPLVMPQNGFLTGLTWINEDDNVDTNVQIYVNGVLLYTWEVRNKRWGWTTNIGGFFNVLQGDRISVFLDRFSSGTGDDTPQDPQLEVFFVMTSNFTNEGGGQYGVT